MNILNEKGTSVRRLRKQIFVFFAVAALALVAVAQLRLPLRINQASAAEPRLFGTQETTPLQPVATAESPQADQVAVEPSPSLVSPIQLPFTPQGSPTMEGKWGRNWAANSAEMAKVAYYEYEFRLDATFSYYGYSFGRPFREEGLYRLDGEELFLAFTHIYKGGKRQVQAPRDVMITKPRFYQDGQALRLDCSGATLEKGLTWDFANSCYQDAQGNKLTAAGSSVQPASTVEDGPEVLGARGEYSITKSRGLPLSKVLPIGFHDFGVAGTFKPNSEEPVSLTIFVHHKFKPSDKSSYADEREGFVKAAKEWLENEGLNPEGIPTTVIDE